MADYSNDLGGARSFIKYTPTTQPITDVVKIPSDYLSDGDQIMDQFGIVYEYSSETRSWNQIGKSSDLGIVTTTSDGLVSPSIHHKLSLLQQLKTKGIDFSSFKLAYATTLPPYYFYFHSGDDLIKFIPESTNQLRIEIDRARLYQRIMRTCCVGPTGPTGDKGDKGVNGAPASNESYNLPSSITNSVYTFESVVNTPINTDISLRLFNNDVQFLEILYNISTNTYEIVSLQDGKSAEIISLVHNTTTHLMSGSIRLGGVTLSNVRHKVRQRGAKGAKGDDGNSFFEIVNETLGDPSLISTDLVVSIRKANISNNISVLKRPTTLETCVSNLSILQDATLITDISDLSLASAQVTTKECKYLGQYKFSEYDPIVDDLDLAAWTPTGDCVQAARYHQYNFDWYNYTDIKYAFKITPNPKPDEQCCQDQFFMCPNVGDQPCGIVGSPTAPVPLPPPAVCECVSPIAEEIQGDGMVLESQDLCTNCGSKQPLEEDTLFSGLTQYNVGSTAGNNVSGLINGIVNRFKLSITVCGKCEVKFILKKDTTQCGGDIQQATTLAHVNSDLVHSTILLESTLGTATISDNGKAELLSINDGASFIIDTTGVPSEAATFTKDVINATININDTMVNYCYGYKLSIVSGCECATEETPPPVIPPPPQPPPQPPPPQPPPQPPPEQPPPKQPPVEEGQTVTGSFTAAAIEENKFVEVQSDIVNIILDPIGDDIFITPVETKIGRITKLPSDLNILDPIGKPFIQIDKMSFNLNNGSYDTNGPLGSGSYMYTTNRFLTRLKIDNLSPVAITDTWTNAILFISDENSSGKRTIILLARLASTEIGPIQGSPLLARLSQTDGYGGLLYIEYFTNSDPIVAINRGDRITINGGRLRYTYNTSFSYLGFPNNDTGLPGTSGQPIISVSPSSLDFGDVGVGSYSELSFVLSNTGTGVLNGVCAVNEPYSIIANSTYSLQPGQQVNVVVRFTPISSGANGKTITCTGGSGATVDIIGVGRAEYTQYLDPDGTISDNGWTINGSNAYSAITRATRNETTPDGSTSIIDESAVNRIIRLDVGSFVKVGDITTVTLHYYVDTLNSRTLTAKIQISGSDQASDTVSTTGWHSVVLTSDISQTQIDNLQMYFSASAVFGSAIIHQAYFEINGLI